MVRGNFLTSDHSLDRPQLTMSSRRLRRDNDEPTYLRNLAERARKRAEDAAKTKLVPAEDKPSPAASVDTDASSNLEQTISTPNPSTSEHEPST